MMSNSSKLNITTGGYLVRKPSTLSIKFKHGLTDRKTKDEIEEFKKGKARGKQFGKVEIPQEAFIGVLKINKE